MNISCYFLKANLYQVQVILSLEGNVGVAILRVFLSVSDEVLSSSAKQHLHYIRNGHFHFSMWVLVLVYRDQSLDEIYILWNPKIIPFLTPLEYWYLFWQIHIILTFRRNCFNHTKLCHLGTRRGGILNKKCTTCMTEVVRISTWILVLL